MKHDAIAQLNAEGSSVIIPGPSCRQLWLRPPAPVDGNQRLRR